MLEIVGNLLELPSALEPDGVALVCIPTNGRLNRVGCAVMGRGVALQARERWPGIERVLGERLKAQDRAGGGNHVQHLTARWQLDACPALADAPWHLASYPTKHHYKDPSPLELVVRSAHELRAFVDQFIPDPEQRVALPRVGCGLGGLSWERQVRPALVAILEGPRWIVVEHAAPR